MAKLSLDDYIKHYLPHFEEAMKRMAHKPECQFRITVYERRDDYIAVLDNNKTIWEAGRSINGAIAALKHRYPELEYEDGVKYYPLGKYYDI